MKSLIASLLLLPFANSVCCAQADADPYKNQGAAPPPPAPQVDSITCISFEEEVISLPILEAQKLLRQTKTDPERYAKAMKLVEEGKAKLERFMVTRVRSGERFISESIV